MREKRRHLVALSYRAFLAFSDVRHEDGWRARLAWWLRGWADGLDGGHSMRLSGFTEPAIDGPTQAKCLHAGLLHAQSLMREAARAESIEDQMRQLCPTLYDEDDES